MARDYGARNRRAQDRLQAMGQPRGAEAGAYYRLRKAVAERRGLSGAQGAGKPRRGERSVSELRQAGQLPPAHRGEPRQVDLGPAGTIYQSASPSFVRSVLRRAARDGKQVSLRITADDGRGPRTRVIGGAGDQGPRRHLGDVVGRGAKVRRGQEKAPDVRVVRKVHIFATSDPALLAGGAGIDPGDLADYLDAYDDWWDAWADLWDAEYESVAG